MGDVMTLRRQTSQHDAMSLHYAEVCWTYASLVGAGCGGGAIGGSGRRLRGSYRRFDTPASLENEDVMDLPYLPLFVKLCFSRDSVRLEENMLGKNH